MSDETRNLGGRCEGCGEIGVLTCFDCLRQEDDGIRAENARLRERVALLEGAEERADASDSLVLSLTDALADAVLLIHETRHEGAPAECAVRVCEIGKQLVQSAREVVVDNLAAALAQAGEGGAA